MRAEHALVFVVLLGGCNTLLGIDDPALPVDAAPVRDVNDASFDGSTVDAIAVECSNPYTLSFGGSRYRHVTDMSSWAAARETCRQDGAHLPIIDTSDEHAFLQTQLRSGEASWIGLYEKPNNPQSWIWVIQPPQPLQEHWAPGEPNNLAGEDCGQIRDGGWNDAVCGASHSAFCECDGLVDPSD